MTLQEFWPIYVLEHLNLRNRQIHALGTSAGILFTIVASITGNAAWIIAALMSGYGAAWCGHFFIEGNRPATFKHPLLSLACDFKMFAYILRGRMDIEIEKAKSSKLSL